MLMPLSLTVVSGAGRRVAAHQVGPALFPSADPLSKGCQVSASRMGTRCSLPAACIKDEALELTREHAQMERYFTQPIHLQRPTTPIQAPTMQSYTTSLLDFMGYLVMHHAYPLEALTLRLVSRGELLESYINFKHAKGVSPGQQSKQYLHLQRVLEYLRHGGASGGYNWNAEQRGVLDNLITSMDAIRTQVSSTKPPRQRVDVEDLQAAGKWVPWKSLAAAATKYANSVLDQCTRAAALDDQELRGRLAPQVSDAMMAMWMVTLPPCRQSSLRALVYLGKTDAAEIYPAVTAPPHLCTTCTRAGCKGNYIRRLGPGQYELLLSHHKNAQKTKEVIGPVRLREESHANPTLLRLLDELFTWAHTAELQQYAHLLSPETRAGTWGLRAFHGRRGAVFSTNTDGISKMTSHMVQVVKTVLSYSGMPTAHITPTALRHIFVEGVRERDHPLTSEEEQAAAYLMGNSPRTWDHAYHNSYRKHQGVTAMQAIHARLLRAPSPSTPAAAAAATDAVHVETGPPPATSDVEVAEHSGACGQPCTFITPEEARYMDRIELVDLHQRIYRLTAPSTSHNLDYLRRAVSGALRQRGPPKLAAVEHVRLPQRVVGAGVAAPLQTVAEPTKVEVAATAPGDVQLGGAAAVVGADDNAELVQTTKKRKRGPTLRGAVPLYRMHVPTRTVLWVKRSRRR